MTPRVVKWVLLISGVLTLTMLYALGQQVIVAVVADSAMVVFFIAYLATLRRRKAVPAS